MKESNWSTMIDVLMLAGTSPDRVAGAVLRFTGSKIPWSDCPFRNRRLQCYDASRYFLSIENANVTRMKRILRTNYNIEKVCDVNQISRQLVSGDRSRAAYQALRASWKWRSSLYQSFSWPLRQPSVLLSSPSCLEQGNFMMCDWSGYCDCLCLLLFSLSCRWWNTFAFLLPLPLSGRLCSWFLAHIWTRAYSGFLPIPISLSQAVSCLRSWNRRPMPSEIWWITTNLDEQTLRLSSLLLHLVPVQRSPCPWNKMMNLTEFLIQAVASLIAIITF